MSGSVGLREEGAPAWQKGAVRPRFGTLARPREVFTIIVVSRPGIFLGFNGLWSAAVHCVLLPALLWDGAGWGAMGRTQALTREYRRPIAGFLLLVAAGCVVVLATLALAAERRTQGRAGLPRAFSILLQGIVVALLAAVPAVIRAWLRTVKEGVGGEDLRAIFG